MTNIEIVDPTNYKDWNEQICKFEDYTFFHSSEWAKLLTETYKYKTKYFVVKSGAEFHAVIPLMIIESILTGKRAVSLPFSDYCEPLISKEINFNTLLDEIIKFLKKEKLKYLELKFGAQTLDDTIPFRFNYLHKLNIDKKEDELFSSFNKSTKSSIKRSIRDGVTVKIDNSFSSVEEFYRINTVTRKKHGLPPQPNLFFKNLHKYILANNSGFVSLANFNGKNIAGAIFLCIGDKVTYKYSASYPDYLHLRGNNLIMYESIKYCIHNKYKEMDFGITEQSNEGLRSYKKGWETEESVIKLYKYDLTQDKFILTKSNVTGFHNKIFSKAPISFLRLFSSIFYSHFG